MRQQATENPSIFFTVESIERGSPGVERCLRVRVHGELVASPLGFTKISPYLGIHPRAKDTSHMPRPRKRMLNNGVRGLRNDGRWQITFNYRVPFDLNRNISSRRSTSHPSRTGRRWPSSHATEKGSTPVVARDEGEAATGDEMRTSSGELLFSVAPQIRCPVDPHDGGLPCFWRRLAHPLAGGVGG